MKTGSKLFWVNLLKAAHFGPTLLVVLITFLISLTQFSFLESFEIGTAIFFGQLVVGWSNDYIDYPLDKSANRINKPLVNGSLRENTLRKYIFIALFLALCISLFSPLGLTGTSVHFLGLLSAVAYNIKLKATIFSLIPYIISFGLLPWAIYLAAGQTPPFWIYLGFALFASAFHFLNVLKDLEWDISQNVLGLPQRLGRNRSILIATICLIAGIWVVLTLGQTGF